MRLRRAVPGAIGILALGLALGLADRSAASNSIEALVELLGNDYLLVAIFAVFALLLALPVVLSGRPGALEQASVPEPEVPVAAPPPGASVDEEAGRLHTVLPIVGSPHRRELRDRLRETAIRTVMRTDGCDRRTATERVDSRTWTADRRAARFLTGGSSGTSNVDWWTLLDWIPAMLGSRTRFERRVERVVDALETVDSAYSGSERGSGSPTERGSGSASEGGSGGSDGGSGSAWERGSRPTTVRGVNGSTDRGSTEAADSRTSSMNGESAPAAGADGSAADRRVHRRRESTGGHASTRSAEGGHTSTRSAEGGR